MALGELKFYILVNILQFAIIFDNMFRIGRLFEIVTRLKEEQTNNEMIIYEEWFDIVIKIVLFPIISCIILVFIGAISDNWPSKRGRRTSIMRWALIPYIIACIIYLTGAIHPVLYLWGNEESVNNDKLFKLGYSLHKIAWILDSFGGILIDMMFRSFILDEFDTSQQDKVNLVRSFMTGLAYFIWYGILSIFGMSTFHWEKNEMNGMENNETIHKVGSLVMYFGSVIADTIFVVCVIIFDRISGEQKYEAEIYGDQSLSRWESVKYSFQNVVNGIKSIDFGVFSVFLIVFFGWIDWDLFTTPIISMERNYLYPGNNNLDTRVLVCSLNYTIVGLLVMIEAVILYKTKWRLDKFTVLSYGVCTLTSICYIFLKPDDNNEHTWRNYFLSSIPLFSASMILTALKSFPYSLMRDTVPRNKHGVTMGIMNIFIKLGETVSYLILFMFEYGHEQSNLDIYQLTSEEHHSTEHLNKYVFVYLLCFVSFIVSIIFYYLRKSIKTDDYTLMTQQMEEEDDNYN